MPTNASRNSLVLPLLGLLVERPAHAYDLTSRLEAKYAHLAVTRSTVTSLLKSLARGLVAAGVPVKVGNRQPRISPRTPIHVVENGSSSGAPRTPRTRCESLSDMLDAILSVQESLDVTQYEPFSLRNADSSSHQPTGTLGIVTDTYQLRDDITVHLDAGYDSDTTRALLKERGLRSRVAHQGEKAPFQAPPG